MEVINNECYVSLEVAKLLKEAGFDWERETCYIGKSRRPYKYHKFFNWNMPRKNFEKDGSNNLFHAFITQKKTNSFISAPTLEVAQKWLREVKNISVDIYSTCYSNWEYIIRKINQLNDKNNTILALTACKFYTYEESKEAGIHKALEVILEEKALELILEEE